MRFRLTLPTIESSDNWRAVLALAGYRTVIGFGLMTVVALGQSANLFDPAMPDIFRLLCLVYLAQAVLMLLAGIAHKPGIRSHVIVQVAVDVALFTLLTYTSAGVSSGLGMLLISSLAAAGVALPGRVSVLFAALAAIGMLYQEGLRRWVIDGELADFAQAGILGSVYFVTVGLAHWSSRRIRETENLAEDRASTVRDLAELNRHIIDRMQIGALVIDSRYLIQTVNQAALDLFGQGNRRPAHLSTLSPVLVDALNDWRDGTATQPALIRHDGRALLPSFARLDAEVDTPILLFIEDAQRQTEQAQQIKLASLGRLTASIAHEIRNPLGAISHAGQLLAESDGLRQEDKTLVEMVHRQTRRIDSIISNILGLSRRPNDGRVRLSLASWLTQALADYCETRHNPPVFDFTPTAFAYDIRFHPGHLQQVLFNLWDNADRYARRNNQPPQIALSCQRTRDNQLALDVRDDGPGVDAAIAEHILEPFFTTDRDGTGLGLHIARELCEANGARLYLVTQPPGACFRIVLNDIDIDFANLDTRSSALG